MALPRHPAGGSLGEKVGAFQVSLDQLVEALLGGFQQIPPLTRSHTSVVDKQIEPAEAITRGSHKRLAIGTQADIAAQDLDAGFLAQRLRRVAPLFVSRDHSVGASKFDGDGSPDAAACAGYDGDRFHEYRSSLPQGVRSGLPSMIRPAGADL